ETDHDPRDAREIVDELRRSSALSAQAATQLQSAKSDEAANLVPAQALHDSLSSAISRLRPMAEQSVRNFLADHASDPALQDALSKVKKLSRSDLAYAALTGQSTRGLKSLA